MGKPKAPKAPDYAAAATAQGAANTNSAVATNFLNQADQVGPYGSLKYSYDGGYTTPEGQFIPKTTATTTLSPGQQALLDQDTNLSLQLNDLASRGVGYVDQASANPIDQSTLPNRGTGPSSRDFQVGFAAPNTQLGGSVAPGDLKYQSKPTSQPIQRAPMQGAFQTSSGGSDIALQNQFSSGNFKTAADQGNMALKQVGGPNGYQTNTRGSQVPLQNRYSQESFTANARPTRLAVQGANGLNPGAGLQTSVPGSGFKNQYNFGGIEAAPKIGDFSAQRDKITNAMMQRLQPYIDKDRAALQTQMANQGLGNGTEARGWEEDKFQRGVNDQRIGALLAGDQEQQNLFNNAMGVRRQGVGEVMSQGDYFNSAAEKTFSQDMAAGQFRNQAQQEGFQQDLASRGFENAAQNQEFGQNQREFDNLNSFAERSNDANQRQASFGNATQGQEYSQSLQAMAARNQAIGQGNSDDLSFGKFNNDLQGQEFGQNQQRLDSFNQGQSANNALSERRSSFNNQARTQQYSESLQEMQARNAATSAENDTALNFAQFGNSAQAQEYGQNQQDFQNFNQASDINFDQRMASNQLNNDVSDREWSRNVQEGQFYNQGQEAIFNQGLAEDNFLNSSRAQAIQEADYFKNQPLNMLNALRSGNQVNMPTFGNVSAGSNIAPTPMYAAAQDQYSASLDAYKAKMANFGAIVGAVGGLGSAAITKSDRRAKTNIRKVGLLPDGLGVYTYGYVWSPDKEEIGVMADEVAELRPWAIGPIQDGYATVNYGAL